MTQDPAPSDPVSPLAPGQVVGGRFAIEREVRTDALGTVLRAIDQRTKRPIALRVLPAGLRAPSDEQLKAEVKLVTPITHKNLASTFGTGIEKSGARYVATEWIEGANLAEELARKRLGAGHVSFADAVSATAQLAEALGALHAKGAVHGGVRPAVVWASPRVKLGEAGVTRAALRSGAPALGDSEQMFLAPELRAGAAPYVASDIFGLGAVFYALVCGRSPSEFVPPSAAHPEATAAADAFLLRCLAPDPAARFASAEEAARAALALVAGSGGVGASLEIDIELDASGKSRRPPPMASEAVPAVGARVSLHEDFRPSLASSIGAGGRLSGPLDGAAPAPRTSQVDLGALIAKIGQSDAARWMVTKAGLDHGPFSGRELVALIGKGEFVGGDGLLNMDTGERKKISEHPDFAEFAEQWRLKKQSIDEQQALVQSAKTEKVGNAAKFLVAGAVFVAAALVAVGFFLSRQAESEEEIASANLADLYERGEVEIEGTAGILEEPPRRAGGGRRPGGGGGGGGGGAGRSYEDAMNEVVDIGDATGSGGEARLSPAQVAGVMNGHIDSFFGCVSAELRGGRSLGRVRIDMAIGGSGAVMGSSVRAGSPEFQRCVQGRVAAIRFPSFSAPRMGASFSFSAD